MKIFEQIKQLKEVAINNDYMFEMGIKKAINERLIATHHVMLHRLEMLEDEMKKRGIKDVYTEYYKNFILEIIGLVKEEKQ